MFIAATVFFSFWVLGLLFYIRTRYVHRKTPGPFSYIWKKFPSAASLYGIRKATEGVVTDGEVELGVVDVVSVETVKQCVLKIEEATR